MARCHVNEADKTKSNDCKRENLERIKKNGMRTKIKLSRLEVQMR